MTDRRVRAIGVASAAGCRAAVFVAAAVAALAGAPAAASQTSELAPPKGTIALLRLPSVFGEGPCEAFKARAVPLFATPGAQAPIGRILVTRPWTFPKEGGCAGLEVKVRLDGVADEHSLPTLEHDYEQPAGIVLERSGAWCRIQLRTRTAWVHKECDSGFMAVEDLLAEKGSVYLAQSAVASARAAPGGAVAALTAGLRSSRSAWATFVAARTVNGVVWAQVDASHVPPCERQPPMPSEISRVWLPLRSADGTLQLWFHSRGC